jgi:hypothetical protein
LGHFGQFLGVFWPNWTNIIFLGKVLRFGWKFVKNTSRQVWLPWDIYFGRLWTFWVNFVYFAIFGPNWTNNFFRGGFSIWLKICQIHKSIIMIIVK